MLTFIKLLTIYGGEAKKYKLIFIYLQTKIKYNNFNPL